MIGQQIGQNPLRAFNPLGAFRADAPVVVHIVDAALRLHDALPIAAAGSLRRLYFHWTAAAYGACFEDYTVEVNFDVGSQAWSLVAMHDPRFNAYATFDNKSYSAATYDRNRGSISIALGDMLGADPRNFSHDGVTLAGLEWLCAGAAALAVRYGINVRALSTDEPYAGEPNALTHAEAAARGGKPQRYEPYAIWSRPTPSDGVTRWDLMSFVPLPPDVEPAGWMADACGNALRERTALYAATVRARLRS